MIPRSLVNKLIIIGFMVLVGFCLAKAIYHKSFMGIVLALVSLGAGVYFLYLVVKAKTELETEEAT
jgi:uncharacterized membrane protein YhfC